MGRGSARTKFPRPIPPATVAGSPADQPRPPTEQPGPPTKPAPEARRLDMDDGLEAPAEADRKRSRSESPPRPRSMSPQEPPSSPPPVALTQAQQPKSKAVRAVNFESKDERMPDQKSCAPSGKKPKLEFDDGDCIIQDSDFAFLMCDETMGEPCVKTEVTVKTEPSLETEPYPDTNVNVNVKKEVGGSRLFDSARKFANEEKTPLKSSTSFNASALLRSASQCLATQFATPPTTKRDKPGKKTPSSSKAPCCLSQPDVFGETSSESESD